MKKYLFLLGFCLISLSAEARPISYPGGTMVMLQNDDSRNAAAIDYTVTPTLAFGVRTEYDRTDKYQIHSLTMNNRLWRGNYPDAQANIYMMSGLGYAIENGNADSSPAAFTGFEADWENRRLFVNYENKVTYAGDVDKEFMQAARVGVAPYVAEAGALHTWLMVQVDHRPEDKDAVTVTPLVRFFKDTNLLEAGISNKGSILFNYTHQF